MMTRSGACSAGLDSCVHFVVGDVRMFWLVGDQNNMAGGCDSFAASHTIIASSMLIYEVLTPFVVPRWCRPRALCLRAD